MANKLLQDRLQFSVRKLQLGRGGQTRNLRQLGNVLRRQRRAQELKIGQQSVVVEVLQALDEPKLDADGGL